MDGLHPYNLGRLAQGGFVANVNEKHKYFVSCTAKGVFRILERIMGGAQNLGHKKVCIVGRSNLVGKPLHLILN